jgi:hypothetical protein
MPSPPMQHADRAGPGIGFWLMTLVALPWAALAAALILLGVEAPDVAGVAWLVLIGAGSAVLLAQGERLQAKPAAARRRWALLGGAIVPVAAIGWVVLVVTVTVGAACFGSACGGD